MVPSGEYLEPHDLSGAEIDLRFEVGDELTMLEPVTDPLLDLPLSNERALHPRIEPDRPGDPPILGVVEGDVGPTQQIGDAALGRSRRGDAGKGADLDHPLANGKGPGYLSKSCFGEAFRATGICRVDCKDGREFIATQAGDDRPRAKLLDQRRRKALQQLVAGVVAMLVVDQLEAVDLDGKD